MKRELGFAAATFVISIILILVSIWSLEFLLNGLNNSIGEIKNNPSEIQKFNLTDFNKINIGK